MTRDTALHAFACLFIPRAPGEGKHRPAAPRNMRMSRDDVVDPLRPFRIAGVMVCSAIQ